MDVNGLSPGLKEMTSACTGVEDLVKLASEEGYELSDEVLDALSGGWRDCEWHGCMSLDQIQEACPTYSPNDTYDPVIFIWGLRSKDVADVIWTVRSVCARPRIRSLVSVPEGYGAYAHDGDMAQHVRAGAMVFAVDCSETLRAASRSAGGPVRRSPEDSGHTPGSAATRAASGRVSRR